MFNKFSLSSLEGDKDPVHNKQESPAELREKLKDPNYLPKYREVLDAFMPPNWEEGYIRDGKEKTIKNWSTEDWDDFLDGKLPGQEGGPVFEVLNEEYLSGLSDYLSRRIQELGGTEESPIVILEVGAGNGRLTYFLEKKLNEKMFGKFRIIASDPGDWEVIPTTFTVEKMGNLQALEKYQPKIVMCSWMPLHKDFSADFRSTPSVEEYILIGEAGGACGDEWETWGMGSERGHKGETIPYEKDGFEIASGPELDELRHFQIGRADKISRIILPVTNFSNGERRLEYGGYSCTKSFRRIHS